MNADALPNILPLASTPEALPDLSHITEQAIQWLQTDSCFLCLSSHPLIWIKLRPASPGTWRFAPATFAERCAAADNDVIHDLATDPRLPELPSLLGDEDLRFYAGAALRSANGTRLGTLAVLDRRSRPDLDHQQLSILRDLAAAAADLLPDAAAIAPPDNHMSAKPAWLPDSEALQRHLTGLLSAPSGDNRLFLLLVTYDGLESLLDTMNAMAAKAVVKLVAERLRAALPPNTHLEAEDNRRRPVLARIPGRGFGIVHSGAGDEHTVIAMVHRVLRTSGSPFDVHDGTNHGRVVFPASIGIAPRPDAGTPSLRAARMLRNAGIALTRAQKAGGGYRIYEQDMGQHADRHQSLHLDLASALQRQELHLAYQPILDIRTSRVTGFEALLRWRHPVYGTIPPTDFIPIAERSGLINDIGQWVLRQACADAMSWPDDIGVSVNLSPVQVRAGWLPGIVRRVLEETALRPVRLELEITESVLLPDSGANLSVLRSLRALGVRIAIDDFGSGYSSLGYLRTFAFDTLKIDQMFVRDLLSRDGNAAIIRAIAGLARDLGINTVAEGVENKAQLDCLCVENCNQAQGFLFSPPVPFHLTAELMSDFNGG